MRRLSVIFVCLLIFTACERFLAYPRTHVTAGEADLVHPILYTQTTNYSPLAWLHGGERFPQGAQLIIQDATPGHPLVPSFYATADANVSFEGTRILFAGKKTAADPWQVYELVLDHGTPRRITSTAEDCIRPMYLPGDLIVYSHKLNQRLVLESLPLAGGIAKRLSFTPGSVLPDDVLNDGRILFSSSFPLGSVNGPEIYTVYSDGSGVESYRCDHGTARFAGKQLSDGDILFVHANGLARFTSPLAHQAPVNAPPGDYAGGLTENSAGVVVVSWRSNGSQNFVLKRWNRKTGTTAGVAAQSDMSLIQPVFLGSRRVPHRHPSGLHEWKYSNLLTLNASINRDRLIDLHSVASVRLFTLGMDGEPRLLGSSPVEKDGSFFLQVPGDQPLRFDLVGPTGKVLERERGWMWARGGEQRICVGCHAGPEHAPDNAVPAVLLRSTDPVVLTGPATPTAEKGGR